MKRISIVPPVFLAMLALFPAAARAGEHARLVVTRDDAASECPDQQALSDAVAARLGYEPFIHDAAATEGSSTAPVGESDTPLIRVGFRREGVTLHASVQVHDAAGQLKGERTLASARGDCAELASTTTLTISILLDPHSGHQVTGSPTASQSPHSGLVSSPRPASEQAAAAPELVAAPSASAGAADGPPPEHSTPSPSARKALRVRVTAAGTGSMGNAPAPAVGFLLGAGVVHGWWSTSAELRSDLPASDSLGSHRARTSFTAANLVPCAHVWNAYGCAVLTLGALHGQVAGASPDRQTSFHALAGPRIGLSIPLNRWLALDGHLEGSYALTRTTLGIAANDLWSTSTLSGLFGIGLVGLVP